jgi:hypothetical protein
MGKLTAQEARKIALENSELKIEDILDEILETSKKGYNSILFPILSEEVIQCLVILGYSPSKTISPSRIEFTKVTW